MSLYLDSADLSAVSEALSWGIEGITTNPSILAKDGATSVIGRCKDIVDLVCEDYTACKGGFHLSVEILNVYDPDKAEDEAKTILRLLQNDYFTPTIKVPLVPNGIGLKIIKRLHEYEIPVNATCLMSPLQAVLAAEAGADYVSLFYNRMIDYNTKVREMDESVARREAMFDIQVARDLVKPDANLIVGSIRKTTDVLEALESDADIVTVPYKYLLELQTHPKTDEAIKEFEEKWKAVTG